MSRSYTDNETVLLEYKGVEVEVYLAYQVDVDPDYGADADGQRGMYREEVELVDKYIVSPTEMAFTKEDVDEILSLAEDKLFTRHGW